MPQLRQNPGRIDTSPTRTGTSSGVARNQFHHRNEEHHNGKEPISRLLFYLYGANFWKGKKKERKRKSSSVGSIFSRLSRVPCRLAWKHGFFGMVNKESVEIDTTATRNGKFFGGMTMLLQCGAAIVFISKAYLPSRDPISTLCLSLCNWLIVDFDVVVVVDIVMSQFIRVDTMDLSFCLPNRFAIHTYAHSLFQLHGVQHTNRTRTIRTSLSSCCSVMMDIFLLFSPAWVDCCVVQCGYDSAFTWSPLDFMAQSPYQLFYCESNQSIMPMKYWK